MNATDACSKITFFGLVSVLIVSIVTVNQEQHNQHDDFTKAVAILKQNQRSEIKTWIRGDVDKHFKQNSDHESENEIDSGIVSEIDSDDDPEINSEVEVINHHHSIFISSVRINGEILNKTRQIKPATHKLPKTFSNKVTLEHDKGWLIVGFTDFNYVPVAKAWVDHMKVLGYENHRIIAMDEKAFENLKRSGYNVLKAVGDVSEEKDKGQRLRKIWKMRIDTVYELLLKGYSVFITDVDSVWLKYINLDSLPKNFDGYNAIATVHPRSAFKKWGFTLCGGLGGYRPSSKMLGVFSSLKQKCLKNCDDQAALNTIYISNEMVWVDHQMNGWGNNFIGYGKRSELKIMVFDEVQVMRGGTVDDCDNAWIMNPMASKDVISKMKMFKKFKSCIK